ncbi:TonB-dependent receptor plug domain-containing protein, partial [Parabacteroides goldsteinii]
MNYLKIGGIGTLLLCMSPHFVMADTGNDAAVTITQQKGNTVTGVITDDTGEPLIGVNVKIKDSTVGTITDFEGKFTLEAPVGSQLEISYIGYKPQIITVGNAPVKLKMKEDSQALDEVIVVGYGTTSTRKMVGAVTSMKTDKIDQLPFSNTASALQGRTPGVIVQQGGAEPGSTPTISIRGGGTPLYVIDGVVREAQDFNSLNSSDIEKISILKDASATAVYGARAGNGIIMVQTKRGKEGQTKIEY